MEQGKDKVVDSRVLRRGRRRRSATSSGSSSRATSAAPAASPARSTSGLKAGRSTYVMMLDDDVECETEGIVRAVTFGDLCRRPTIVGGHMFSICSRRPSCTASARSSSRTASGGAPPPASSPTGTSAGRNLRSARWLHAPDRRRLQRLVHVPDPDARCSPRSASRLPLFIKWDDSEYGLRAKEAGYPTVTFPGAAVWHVPWTDKNDALDWQAYFHHRNRFIAALLHSPYPRGGRMVRESLNHQVKHLVSMQYSTVELRHQALEDVLAGPGAAARGAADQAARDPGAGEAVRRRRSSSPTRRVPAGQAAQAAAQGHSDARPRSISGERPRCRRCCSRCGSCASRASWPRSTPRPRSWRQDAKWYRIARYDSAIVSMPDGTSAAFYRRDPTRFRDLLKRTIDDPPAAAPRVGRPRRGVPRGAARDDLAGGVGGDLPPLAGGTDDE